VRSRRRDLIALKSGGLGQVSDDPLPARREASRRSATTALEESRRMLRQAL
jgi:hypothetical protein